jgi:hypothetical protein
MDIFLQSQLAKSLHQYWNFCNENSLLVGPLSGSISALESDSEKGRGA